MAEQLASAGVGASVQASSGSTLSAPNPPARSPWCPTSGWPWRTSGPAMQAGVNGESAAADAVMTRGDGSRWDECRPLTAAYLQLLGHRT